MTDESSLVGQQRRLYSPDRTEWIDYVVDRPARGGYVWVRRTDQTSEMTMKVRDVLRLELVRDGAF